MTWNYRIIKHDKRYTIHDVYYYDGKIDYWTREGVAVAGETLDELKEDFEFNETSI